MILLDTDVMIDLWRKIPPAEQWLRSVDAAQELLVPGFAAMELIQGCRDKSELHTAERLLKGFRFAWPDRPALDAAYHAYRTIHLGNAVGILDVIMAHTAIALDVPLYTFNQKHFDAVTGLKTIQPYLR